MRRVARHLQVLHTCAHWWPAAYLSCAHGSAPCKKDRPVEGTNKNGCLNSSFLAVERGPEVGGLEGWQPTTMATYRGRGQTSAARHHQLTNCTDSDWSGVTRNSWLENCIPWPVYIGFQPKQTRLILSLSYRHQSWIIITLSYLIDVNIILSWIIKDNKSS